MELRYEFDDGEGVIFDRVAVLANEHDNCAIATRKLTKGLQLDRDGVVLELDCDVLEGHRFAVRRIEQGEELLSWQQPFGKALRTINPGQYVYNTKVASMLLSRSLVSAPSPNFVDYIKPFSLDSSPLNPGKTTKKKTIQRQEVFDGYVRSHKGLVGTRNYVIVVAVCNSVSAFVERVAKSAAVPPRKHFHGVVPVTHTETGQGNNKSLLLRTLAGFITHPNVGAALIVGHDTSELEQYMRTSSLYSDKLNCTTHAFWNVEHVTKQALSTAVEVVQTRLVPATLSCLTTKVPVSNLSIALQCGGSDAFSGITGNPLVGAVAKELIEMGGTALLAETDELIGSESWILENVKNDQVAREFIGMVDRIKELLSWHGVSAEGNPSGGNLYRGLYNIALKALGAATKKPRDVQLDGVVDYGEVIPPENGYYFMHSPGNDLESISGQVASGCTVVFFTTGNGSITNFPFVPTIKVVTTTGRYELLKRDMDFNAGRLTSGVPLETLTRELSDLLVKVASGQLTLGERAHHSQVAIWRDWKQTSLQSLDQFNLKTQRFVKSTNPVGYPTPVIKDERIRCPPEMRMVRLVMPTSLCSSQIAKLIANNLSKEFESFGFVSLPHTEGCGSNYGPSDAFGRSVFDRLILGQIMHPHVAQVILLEHGCEMNHNDYMRNNILATQGHACLSRIGFASVQLDGGIESVTKRCKSLVRELEMKPVDPTRYLCVGFLYVSEPPEQFSTFMEYIVSNGGSVVVVQDDKHTLPSLHFGEQVDKSGFHVMECPTDDYLERVTGLASAGVDAIICYSKHRQITGHPFVPMIHVGLTKCISDVVFEEDSFSEDLLGCIERVLMGEVKTRVQLNDNLGFQLSRGYIGVSV